MSDHAHAVLRDALTLPASDRAELIHDLLTSLDDAPAEDRDEVAQAWTHELEQRARKALAGTSHGVDWATARDQVRDQLTGG